ncbi:hypothetical protein [uncultured Cohaesibacter sp.]|uniref:hypothetical protein n=1 Tax=uncultured Cohaesibacter sp. TaxID=1002546 RepID=UPI0029C97E15|nr:hypothetical protein [uncultured Cohaesibacter sp.]
MSLELSQLHKLKQTKGASIWIGKLPQEVQLHLGSKMDNIYLSQASLIHILTEHQDVNLFELLIIPEMLLKGLWIADRPNWCCISFQCTEEDRRYKAAIKAADNGYEHYLTTFHKTSKRQTKSILKRGPVLRKHL